MDDWVELGQKVGLPIALLAVGVAVVWALSRRLLSSLIEAYRERIAALSADRDHFRARAEAADDRMNGLCRELIDECRAKPRAREGADGC